MSALDDILWSINPEEVDRTVAQAKQATKDLFIEIVGENEPIIEIGDYPDIRNDLRAELRTKIEEL